MKGKITDITGEWLNSLYISLLGTKLQKNDQVFAAII